MATRPHHFQNCDKANHHSRNVEEEVCSVLEGQGAEGEKKQKVHYLIWVKTLVAQLPFLGLYFYKVYNLSMVSQTNDETLDM